MAASVEFLRPQRLSRTAREILDAMQNAAQGEVRARERYAGDCDGLMLWGVGHPDAAAARDRHIARGGWVAHWDMGYFGKQPRGGYFRLCLDDNHPQRWLGRTPDASERWQQQDITLRDDADLHGRIVLVGMGQKSQVFPGAVGWEDRKLAELRRRFPGRRIVFRPKPHKQVMPIAAEVDRREPIEKVLRGAALVVCRHSNVAIDACIAGVPAECEDGAACWLLGKPFTSAVRLNFLRRLAHWNWKAEEAGQAWKFLGRMTAACD